MPNTLNHLAIIMDGNGRWAKQRGHNRTMGHKEGVKSLRKITKFVAQNNIKFLTLYAFSTENWKRPNSEIDFLMHLLLKFLKKELPQFLKNNVKFQTIGDLNIFSDALKNEILKTKEKTSHCSGLTQCLAINYGSKNEIVRATKSLIEKEIEITEESLENALDTSFMPPVDLLIRTGGQSRLSNFLLWQAAYAELAFTSTLWPDFDCLELKNIINKYENTHRRFGGI